MTAILSKLTDWWNNSATATKLATLAVAAAVLVVGTVWLT